MAAPVFMKGDPVSTDKKDLNDAFCEVQNQLRKREITGTEFEARVDDLMRKHGKILPSRDDDEDMNR